MRTRRHKLIYFYELKEWELYDLLEDPQELNNVYEDPAYADVVRQLKQRLSELRDQYDDHNDDDSATRR